MPSTQDQIESRTAAMNAKVEEAKQAIPQFIDATEKAIGSQALPIVRAIGQAQSAVSTKLGESGIAILVGEVKLYIADLHTNLQTALSKRSAWEALDWTSIPRYQPHPRAAGSKAYIPSKMDENENINHHIIDALQPLAQILMRHGFTTTDDTYRHLPSYAVFKRFKWSEEMHSTFKLCSKFEYDARQIENEITSLKLQKSKEDAVALWDAAS